jgi:hypothetical protein
MINTTDNVWQIQSSNNFDNHEILTNPEKKYCTHFKKRTEKIKKIINKQIIYSTILRKTKDALDELSIPFFLSSGTCLGYLRENKFLDHDYDIDVGIFEIDYNPEIVNKMADKGLFLYRTLGDVKTGLELSFRLPGTSLGKNAKIDIFLHYKTGDKIFWSSYIAPLFKKKIKYQVSNFILKPVNFMDVVVNVPHPTVKYIREHYGDKWYIPLKPKAYGGNYDYRTTPKSIVK